MTNFRRRKGRVANDEDLLSRRFWCLIAFLSVLVVLGGTSRGSFWGVTAIRPLAIVVACLATWTLTREQVRTHWFLFAMLASVTVVTALQLVPLPYAIWSQLPGRGIILDIDRTAGLREIARPLTMSPFGTRNALYSMAIPFAVLILGVQLSVRELRALLMFFIGFGLLSAGIASLQILRIVDAPLPWYQLANDGSGSGLFTNRNHQALLLCCMLPMLALLAAAPRTAGKGTNLRPILCALAGMFLLPLILLTGSRGGLVFVAACAPVALVLFRIERGSALRRPSSRSVAMRQRRWMVAAAGASAVVLTVAIAGTIASGRAETVSRFAAMDISDTLRRQTWGVVRQAIHSYLPVGSGIGSYERVFSTLEPVTYLRPSHSNHAHNDWLEVVMTAGLPGAAWLLAGVAGFAILMRGIMIAARGGQRVAWSLLGAWIVLVAGLSSIVDYPLRVPMMSALFVIACLWSTLHLQAPRRVSRASAGPVE